MRINIHTLAAALRAICIEHGTLPLDGVVDGDLQGLRQGAASDTAREVLRGYEREGAASTGGWAVQPDQANHGENVVIVDAAGNVIVRDADMSETHARRIVAAVNACADIPAELLEAGAFTKIEDDPLYELVPGD